MYDQKTLVLAERTKFFESVQRPDETVMKYLQQLKEESRYCQFERVGLELMFIEDEIIVLRLSERISDLSYNSRMASSMCGVLATTGID